MLKVLKNLRKSAISVIIIVILLCLQAATDLALPDYTSKIVNVGIQAGGIENPVPEILSSEQMESILLFTNDDEKILEYYSLVENRGKLNKKQTDIVNNLFGKEEIEKIYIINDKKEVESEELQNIIAKPLMITTYVTNEETAKEIREKILEGMNNIGTNNIDAQMQLQASQMLQEEVPTSQLQEKQAQMLEMQKQSLQDMSLIDIIKQMPKEQLEQMLEEYHKQLETLQGSTLSQAATGAVKQIYKDIGIDTDKIQNNYILLAGLQMLGVALISMVAAVIIMLLSSRVAAKLGKILREQVFNKVLKFSTKEFREFSTASLITRSTNDIQQIQMLMSMLFRVVVYAPIIGVGGLIRVISTSDLSMAWIIALAIFLIIAIVLILFIIAMPKFRKGQELIDKINKVSREILTGVSVIRAFNTQKREENRFEEANKDVMKNSIFVNRAMSIMMPMMMFVMNSIMLLIIWAGGHNVDQGIMQVGDMMAFIQYTMQIVMSFLMISMISIMLPRAQVSAKRINEVLETEPNIKDIENPKAFDETKKGLVEFKNVSFRYPDADTEIITDIDFTVNPGETTAIIGSTGSGKSTVINLIPRFYDVTGGEILVDGVNIKEVPQKELRKRIGYIPQKGVLFSGTIASNIKYGNEKIEDKQMEFAADIAQATEFIEAKEEKYLSPIAQGGNNVSGGQKQRLSIARALAIDPEIFIFDDSFSALDLKTDRKLREALAEKTVGKTMIIVAQRISTIINADQIIVLEEGKIVGKGTHEELMENCETYKQIALSQLSEDELKGKEG